MVLVPDVLRAYGNQTSSWLCQELVLYIRLNRGRIWRIVRTSSGSGRFDIARSSNGK